MIVSRLAARKDQAVDGGQFGLPSHRDRPATGGLDSGQVLPNVPLQGENSDGGHGDPAY